MSIADVIIAELEQEAHATKRVFERIPDDKLSWRPHQKSRSIGQLALHIAQVPLGVSSMAVPDASEPPSMDSDPEPKSKKELLKTFEDCLSRAKEILSGMSDEKMMSPWSAKVNGKTVFTTPRMAFLRSILLNHNYHHRGQLTVYLRLLDIPVPSVYGPSADENPFA
jgi:uncharacterized damage-inducible protein DinB